MNSGRGGCLWVTRTRGEVVDGKENKRGGGARGRPPRGISLGTWEREGSVRGFKKGVQKGVPIEILGGGPGGGPKREFPPPIWGGTHVGVPKGSYGGERSLGEGPKGGAQRGFP